MGEQRDPSPPPQGETPIPPSGNDSLAALVGRVPAPEPEGTAGTPPTGTEDRGAPPTPSPGASGDQQPPSPPTSEPSPPPPISWKSLSQEDRRRLLDEADAEELRRHERVGGIAGRMADSLATRRVQDLRYEDLPPTLRETLDKQAEERAQERSRQERARQLAQAGDYYELGKLAEQDFAQRGDREAQARQDQEAQAKALRDFQERTHRWARETYPPEVLQAAADAIRDDPVMNAPVVTGDVFRDQYQVWHRALSEKYAEHRAAEVIAQERKRWESEEAPAIKQRALAALNGAEPSPETEGGPPAGLRRVTDEDIRRMSPDEFAAVWDEKAGRFKDGIQHVPTDSLDLRSLKVTGRAV